MLLITELLDDVKYTSEEVVNEKTGEKKKNLYIEGIFLQGGVVNRNKRFYPLEILEGEVNRYVTERISRGQGYGELGHPNGPQINLERVSHMTTGLHRDGNNFVGKARIADTPYGNIAKGLMESGARLGVSSRGLGSLVPNKQGINEVQKDFRLAAAADIVADPSAPDAFVNGIMEGVEFVQTESGWQAVETAKIAAAQVNERRRREGEALKIFERFLRDISRNVR